MRPRVVVIGAGLGGLAAAIEAAHGGAEVTILEALDRPGGKAGVETRDGVSFDTGPSLLTLPEIAWGLLDRVPGGRDRLRLVRPRPAFRYRYPDRVELDVFIELEETLAGVERVLGRGARHELADFLTYARRIWEAAAPPFLSMNAAIRAQVREPHLVALLQRYATYNGSDVRSAPATLNCIAHVELALGGFGVEGGVGALVLALVATATDLGVTLRCGLPARRLLAAGGRVCGVETDEGLLPAEAVVVNADPAHLARDLLPAAHRAAVVPAPEPSMSAWTGVFQARRQAHRAAHTVVFPMNYEAEFIDLFDEGRPPRQPTVYASAQSVAHNRPAWPDHEPLFVMINAPAEPLQGRSDPARSADLADLARARLVEAGLLDPHDPLLWERDAAGLAAQFPGSRGAIYGAASNSRFAAFQRPANRCDKLPGLYLASGGAHPGGGMPLVMQSGRLAAAALLEDLGATP